MTQQTDDQTPTVRWIGITFGDKAKETLKIAIRVAVYTSEATCGLSAVSVGGINLAEGALKSFGLIKPDAGIVGLIISADPMGSMVTGMLLVGAGFTALSSVIARSAQDPVMHPSSPSPE